MSENYRRGALRSRTASRESQGQKNVPGSTVLSVSRKGG